LGLTETTETTEGQGKVHSEGTKGFEPQGHRDTEVALQFWGSQKPLKPRKGTEKFIANALRG